MLGAKEVTTPLSSQQLLVHDGSPAMDARCYQQMVGALQYIFLTRPDISFTVGKLSQFMHRPIEFHLSAVKRVLRYLKHTISHSLLLRGNAPLTLSMPSPTLTRLKIMMITRPHPPTSST